MKRLCKIYNIDPTIKLVTIEKPEANVSSLFEKITIHRRLKLYKYFEELIPFPHVVKHWCEKSLFNPNAYFSNLHISVQTGCSPYVKKKFKYFTFDLCNETKKKKSVDIRNNLSFHLIWLNVICDRKFMTLKNKN